MDIHLIRVPQDVDVAKESQRKENVRRRPAFFSLSLSQSMFMILTAAGGMHSTYGVLCTVSVCVMVSAGVVVRVNQNP